VRGARAMCPWLPGRNPCKGDHTRVVSTDLQSRYCRQGTVHTSRRRASSTQLAVTCIAAPRGAGVQECRGRRACVHACVSAHSNSCALCMSPPRLRAVLQTLEQGHRQAIFLYENVVRSGFIAPKHGGKPL
jgi:hypothetical protein